MVESSRPNYVRLPPDAEFLRIWNESGHSQAVTAEQIGCSPAAIHQKLKRMGIWEPRQGRVSARRSRTSQAFEGSKSALERSDHLERRVIVLENQLKVLKNQMKTLLDARFDPNISTKRIQDGGEHAKTQRERAKTEENQPNVVNIAQMSPRTARTALRGDETVDERLSEASYHASEVSG